VAAKVLALSGSTVEQLDFLQQMSDKVASGAVRFFHIVALETDGTVNHCFSGHCSFIEKLGCLEMAKDTLLRSADNGED